jgi:hypothetical protein
MYVGFGGALMAERMRRTQVLFPEDEYQRLQRLAREQGRSVGSLVREAVERCYPGGSREARIAAARRIANARLPLPVQDWGEIEDGLTRARGKPGCR